MTHVRVFSELVDARRIPLETSSPPATERLHRSALADWFVAGLKVYSASMTVKEGSLGRAAGLHLLFTKSRLRVRRNLSRRVCEALYVRPARQPRERSSC